jgi:hypothetical protein
MLPDSRQESLLSFRVEHRRGCLRRLREKIRELSYYLLLGNRELMPGMPVGNVDTGLNCRQLELSKVRDMAGSYPTCQGQPPNMNGMPK